jgi:hypothetical protein
MSELTRIWQTGCLGKLLVGGAGCVVMPILLAGMGIGCWVLFVFLRAVVTG